LKSNRLHKAGVG